MGSSAAGLRVVGAAGTSSAAKLSAATTADAKPTARRRRRGRIEVTVGRTSCPRSPQPFNAVR